MTLCTDVNSKQVNLDKRANDDDAAVKDSIIDFYANRYDNPRLQNELQDVHNLIDFVRKFNIKNNQFVARDNSDKTVIITLPKLRFNPNDAAKYQNYCYHQAIKYMPWDK